MPKGIYSDPIKRGLAISEGLKKSYAKGNRLKIFSGKRGGFKKGFTPWNKGMKGFMAGEKNGQWKGGITESDSLARNTFKKRMQKLIFERDNYTCQFCGVRGEIMQIDHIQSWSEYVELRFSMDNCRTLCMKCHYKITYNKEMPSNIKTWGFTPKYMKNQDRRVVS